MSGLFDLFASDDPKQAAYMAMAAGLLGGKGNFNTILAESMLGAQKSAQQARQAQQASEMNRMQLAAAQRQAKQQARQDELAALPMQFYKPPSMPAVDATGGMETAASNPNNAAGPGGFDMQGYLGALMGKDPIQALQLQAMTQKQKAQRRFEKVGDNLLEIPEEGDPRTVFSAPTKPEKPPSAVQEYQFAQSQGYKGSFEQWDTARRKAGAATQNMNFGTPMPAVNPKTGEVELLRPDNKGGMNFTGIKPPPQDRDVKLPAELQRMQIAGDAMVSLMDTYEGMLKKHNPRDPMVQANPQIRASMQSIKRNIELQFKELQALGALAGPDIEIMRQSLADPFSFSGAYFGKEGLLAQVKQAKDLVKIRSDAVLKSQGRPGAASATQPDNDPLGLRK